MIVIVIPSMLWFPGFLTVSLRFPWYFRMFLPVFLRFPSVILPLPCSVSIVSNFRFCDKNKKTKLIFSINSYITIYAWKLSLIFKSVYLQAIMVAPWIDILDIFWIIKCSRSWHIWYLLVLNKFDFALVYLIMFFYFHKKR